MTVLITGGSGFVGRALVARLHDRPIRIAQRSDASAWEKVVAGADTVVHLAARVHVMRDREANPLKEFRAVNVDQTINLATAAAAAGTKRFVFISTVKVNGESTLTGKAFTEKDVPDPKDPYSISKNEAEIALRHLSSISGMEVVIIRPPLVYGAGVKGNFATLLKAVKNGWPLPLGAIHNKRSLVALVNLVDFVETCMSHPSAANQTFLVSDGNDMSTTELIRSITIALGQPERLWAIPPSILRMVGRLTGKQDAVERLCGNLQIDITKARTVLGWFPPVSTDKALPLSFAGLK